jgi:8-oxo-dGTP pyrophosphatase MutT (NUDIX family)
MNDIQITAGGIVCSGTKLLLIWKEGGTKDGWVLPKGHVEPGETREQAAIREVKEETGLTVTIQQYLGSLTRQSIHPGYEGVRKEVHVYLMQWDGKPAAGITDEHSEWVDIDDADIRYAEEAAFIAKHRAAILATAQ